MLLIFPFETHVLTESTSEKEGDQGKETIMSGSRELSSKGSKHEYIHLALSQLLFKF